MRAEPVKCPECGQPGNRYPGLRLGEFENLDAVITDDGAVPTPQRLTCRNCGHSWAVPRGSVEVRQP